MLSIKSIERPEDEQARTAVVVLIVRNRGENSIGFRENQFSAQFERAGNWSKSIPLRIANSKLPKIFHVEPGKQHEVEFILELPNNETASLAWEQCRVFVNSEKEVEFAGQWLGQSVSDDFKIASEL